MAFHHLSGRFIKSLIQTGMRFKTRAKQFIPDVLGNIEPSLSNPTSPTRFQNATSKILKHAHSHLPPETNFPLSPEAWYMCLIGLFVSLHGNNMQTSAWLELLANWRSRYYARWKPDNLTSGELTFCRAIYPLVRYLIRLEAL
jgi:hypothetical protein